MTYTAGEPTRVACASVSELSARGESRRASIIAVARTVLVERGLDDFVLRTIAAQVGITLGNLQYYFATRDDLLVAVIETEFADDVEIIRANVGHADDSRKALTEVARGLVEHWCAGGAVFSTLTVLSHHHERFRDLNRTIYRRFYDELAVLIRAAAPTANDEEVNLRTRLVTAVLDGIAIQNHAICDDTGTDLLERATSLIVTVASGPQPTRRSR